MNEEVERAMRRFWSAFDEAELAEIDDMLNASENELFASMELHEWLACARRIWPEMDEGVATSWWQFAQERRGHHESQRKVRVAETSLTQLKGKAR